MEKVKMVKKNMARINRVGGKGINGTPSAVSTYVDRGPNTSFKMAKVKVGGNGKTSKKFNIYKKGKMYGGQ